MLRNSFHGEKDCATETLCEGGVSRRQLLQGSLATAAAAVLAHKAWAVPAQAATLAQPGPARAWRTDVHAKHAPLPLPDWKPGVRANVPDLIVDGRAKLQPILGFGACLTDSSCFLLSRMPAAQRDALLHELYSPEEANFSVGRGCVGSSDWALSLYNFDDVPGDVAMKHFSIAHDEAYILPAFRQIRSIRPDFFLHVAPWSPPGWMKVYGSMKGGWMSREYLGPYADYLLRFLAAYREAGVPVQALCTQNEVETDQHSMMPACFWTPEMEAEFLRDHLGPKLRADPALKSTQLWLLDYNYIYWKRVDWQLRDPALARLVDGVAFHGYEGEPEQMSELARRYPSLPIYFTEWSSELKKDLVGGWATWAASMARILSNGARNITLWNLLLDERGEPEIGPYEIGGTITLNSKTGEMERNGQYWALRHYAAHLRRGARRLDTSIGDRNFAQVAFQNPDGEYVLVLTNQSTPRDVQVLSGGRVLEVPLAANSVTTVTWQADT